jgi:hypothetical protein
LVLDWGNSTLGNPVNRVSKVAIVEDLDVLLKSHTIVDLLVSSKDLSLLSSPSGELVDANDMGHGWIGVDVIDLSQVLLEDLRSELVLSSSSVVLVVLNNVGHELVVGISHDLSSLEEASVGVA